MTKLPLLCLSAVMAITSNAQDLHLDIISPSSDTVSTAKINLVAVTVPGATATIQGQNAHVYKTGSFGAPIDLSMGDNAIEVSVAADGQSRKEVLHVYRKEASPIEVKEAPKDQEVDSFTAYTLPGAFLVYGNGDDRLGGSKMGFIAEGIPVRVVAQTDELYKVQLSANRYAYIEKGYLKREDTLPLAAVNTGSWSITNQGKHDRVTISLPRRLPYRSWTLLEPSTLCVELYGAMDNSNWITQHGPLGIIDYCYFQQTESDVYQVIIRLRDKYCWGYSIDYSGNSLNIDVRLKPQSLALKDLVIGLDAGHGGSSTGAVSPSGLKESDINLDIVKQLQALLEQAGATVVLTRHDDSSLTMAERKHIWREANVDIAISVHNNAGGSPFTPMGTSVYYKHLFDRPLSVCMHESLLELGVADYGLTGNFNFSLNGPTDYPNVLVEGLFMSSLIEEEMLADAKVRKQIAEKILKGLKQYLDSAK